MTDDDYYTIRTGGTGGGSGTGGEGGHRPKPLRVALAFAAGALAITLVAVPMVREHMDETRLASRPLDLDTRAVGSLGVGPRGGPIPRRAARGNGSDARRYIVRRSVLSAGEVCVIRGNGGRTGNC